MLKAIDRQEDRTVALVTVKDVATKLESQKLGRPAKLVEEARGNTATYRAFPSTHCRRHDPESWEFQAGTD
jgi:hypothetical protein